MTAGALKNEIRNQFLSGIPAEPEDDGRILCAVPKEAVQGFIPAMRTYLDVFTEAVSSWEGLKSGQYVGYERLVQSISAQTPEGNIEKRYAFVGTPDEVVEQVRYMRELFGEIGRAH